jgi:hypothetical protein
VVQHTRRLRLLFESTQPVRVLMVLCGQDFDGDVPAQPRIESLPDLAHAAGADRRDQLV